MCQHTIIHGLATIFPLSQTQKQMARACMCHGPWLAAKPLLGYLRLRSIWQRSTSASSGASSPARSSPGSGTGSRRSFLF